MKKEFGSEFWEVPVIERNSTQIPDELHWFMSGRMALSYIIKDMKSRKKIYKVGVPSWCCDSMILPFLLDDIEVVFYPVVLDKEKGIIQDYSIAKECDALLVVDYFGYKNSPKIEFDGYIILDVTQSAFSNINKDVDYIFGSLRKWAGFYTGGFAYCKNDFNIERITDQDEKYSKLRKLAMDEKRKYILGETNDKGYLNIFSDAENYLENIFYNGSIKTAEYRDIYSAKHIDFAEIKKQRQRNASIIHEMLQGMTMFKELKMDEYPLFVPLALPRDKRDRLYKLLIENRIYCPIHWPITEYHKLNEETKKVYDYEISVICDQRYDEDDMSHICNIIKNFLGK